MAATYSRQLLSSQSIREMMMEGLPAESLLLRPRPKLREIRALAESVDTVVVLLMEREDAAPLLGAWQATGVEVIHVDWGLRRDGDEAVRDCAEQVASRLRSGRRVLIHCAAGMHRTGRVAYESLRLLGFDRDEAVAEIRRIRPVTADAVERVLAGTTATSSLAGDRIESFWGEYRFLSNFYLIDVRFDGRT